jgi:hypothetical protein
VFEPTGNCEGAPVSGVRLTSNTYRHKQRGCHRSWLAGRLLGCQSNRRTHHSCNLQPYNSHLARQPCKSCLTCVIRDGNSSLFNIRRNALQWASSMQAFDCAQSAPTLAKEHAAGDAPVSVFSGFLRVPCCVRWAGSVTGVARAAMFHTLMVLSSLQVANFSLVGATVTALHGSW